MEFSFAMAKEIGAETEGERVENNGRLPVIETKNSSNRRGKFRQRIKNFLIRNLLFAGLLSYPRILRPVSPLAEAGLETLAWRLATQERERALSQIRQAMPEFDDARARKLSRGLCRHLSRCITEVLELRIDPEGALSRVRFAPGAEKRLRETHELGRGIVFATGHIGNWELLAARLVRTGLPIHTFFKPSYDPGLDRLVRDFRRSYGIDGIDRDAPNLSEQLKSVFRNGGVLGVLMDQDTKTTGIFTDFFGFPAYTPTGAASLALKNDAPLLVGWIHRTGLDHELFIEGPFLPDPTADRNSEIRRLTTAATCLLEGAIRRRPEQWVWFHERWKTRPKA